MEEKIAIMMKHYQYTLHLSRLGYEKMSNLRLMANRHKPLQLIFSCLYICRKFKATKASIMIYRKLYLRKCTKYARFIKKYKIYEKCETNFCLNSIPSVIFAKAKFA